MGGFIIDFRAIKKAAPVRQCGLAHEKPNFNPKIYL
jgi:hypothetical protein